MFKDIIGKKCNQGKIIAVINGNAGFYIGTDGFSNCRMSGYYDSEEDALNGPIAIRVYTGDSYCNNGGRCF